MGTEKLITPIQLYNIVSIRTYRFDLELSGPDVSYGIKKSKNFIGSIENGEGYYTDDVMNDIASYFSEVAKEKQETLRNQNSRKKIKTEYTIHDFYPKKPLPDTKVVKRLDPIPKGSGPTITLNAVLETSDFFDVSRRLSEIVAHCNQLQNQQWQGSDFTQTISRLMKKGRLREVPVEGGFTAYVKTGEEKQD